MFTLVALLVPALCAVAQYSSVSQYNIEYLDNYYERGWHTFVYDSVPYRTLSDSTVEVFNNPTVAVNRTRHTLTIPQTVYDTAGNAYTVTRLGALCFANFYRFDSIVLPETIEEIGESAFSYRDITHIAIPQSVRRIESFAFELCRLTGRVTLPDSLEYIGPAAFHGVSSAGRNNVKEFYISPDNRWFCTVDGMLYNKDTTVVLMATRYIGDTITMPQSVRRIGEYAYLSCQQSTAIVLGDNVRELGMCFLPPTITSFDIPNTVVHIDGPIYNCQPTVFTPTIVTGSRSNYYIADGMVRSIHGDTLVMCFGVWSGNKSLPEGIRVIAPEVFKGNNTLRRFDLPSTLEEIGDYAFASRTVDIVGLPYGLKRIGSKWLDGNATMNDTMILPATVEYLGDEAFSHCSLTTLVLSDSLKVIPRHMILGSNDLRSIYVGSHVERISPEAFTEAAVPGVIYNNTLPLKVSPLPATLRTVGLYAFYNRSMDSVVFLGAPDSIGENAFNLCPRVVFYDSVPPVVFDDAFANANTVVVPCGATTTFANAPGWGTAFTYVEMPCHVAVDDIDEDCAIHVAPNPATTTVTIKSDMHILQVEAYDAVAKKVYGLYTDSETITLDVRRWPSGTYLLRIHTPQGTAVKKLVVRK